MRQQGFAPGLDADGMNSGDTTVFLSGSVLKSTTGGTKVLSSYVDPGEQVDASALSPRDEPSGGGGSTHGRQELVPSESLSVTASGHGRLALTASSGTTITSHNGILTITNED